MGSDLGQCTPYPVIRAQQLLIALLRRSSESEAIFIYMYVNTEMKFRLHTVSACYICTMYKLLSENFMYALLVSEI